MYEKQTITSIRSEEKISAKTNKPYERLWIKTEKHPDKEISGFGSASTKDWKVGTEVELKVTESVSPDGKRTYVNFEYPRKASLETRVAMIEMWMDSVKRKEQGLPPKQTPVGGMDSNVQYPDEGINVDDIPF
jgi:hypothetical protein